VKRTTVPWTGALIVSLLTACQIASWPPGAASPTATPRPRAAAQSPLPTATVRGSPSPTSGVSATATPRASPAPTVRLAQATASATVRPSPTPPGFGRGTPLASTPAGGVQLAGEIVVFAASARVMQLRLDNGTERPVSLAASATLRWDDGAPASATDLGPGLRVRVAGRPGAGGSVLADEVVLLRRR
jgi:hypothetical protein